MQKGVNVARIQSFGVRGTFAELGNKHYADAIASFLEKSRRPERSLRDENAAAFCRGVRQYLRGLINPTVLNCDGNEAFNALLN